MRANFRPLLLTVAVSFFSLLAGAQAGPAAATAQRKTPPRAVAAPPDLSRQPTLYVVGYAHLDTEWRWEYPQVIREYLSKTLRSNFALFRKYPDYVFNFSGANRYQMMKEYYPEDFATLKKYVAEGRWFPAGSSMEESDVNSPSAESIFRQVLYGNDFFRREFGKASAEYMLPDCFGFPASLPSILAHAGIKGFSTQKLTWGSSAPVGGPDSPERTPEGTPFNVGLWEGPDGHSLLAALNPGSYGSKINTDLTQPLPPVPASQIPPRITPEQFQINHYQRDWARRVETNGKLTGVYADYHYYGTGDIGGAPSESSLQLLEAILHKGQAVVPGYLPSQQAAAKNAKPVRVGEGPVRVISARADQMFLDISPAQYAHLPRYKGELELTNHSAGSLTSESYHKRWNRQNEVLGQAAEEASLAAAWLGGRPYPLRRINRAWRLVMGGQFHDTMAGTATPKSYNYAWNDDVIAMNQFAGVTTSAVSAVAAAMNTQAQGETVVVYNPLNIARQDVVEADLRFASEVSSVRVLGPDGQEVPSQVEGERNGATRVLFLAGAPSVGFAAYDIEPGESRVAAASQLKVSQSGLENARYRIRVDANGDVASLFDKQLNRELLSAPLRLAIQTEKPQQWPAWNMDWSDASAAPRAYVGGPATVRVVENGPARVALEISRESEGSKFVQTIRLSAGTAGNRVEFATAIDWHTGEAALKAVFPLAAANPNATYNWDVGTIARPNMTAKKFEVPSHQWFDLTGSDGAFGVTVLSDCKYGSDKPDDHTLRLTLIYTPGLGGSGTAYSDQTSQDFGHHEFVYGLAAHEGDWRNGETDWQAWRLNQPLLAFTTPQHAGPLGKQFSFVSIDNPGVRVLALKKAEHGDDIVIRMVELDGITERNVRVQFAAPVISAREMNAQEMPLGPATVAAGKLVADFQPFGLHTFAVRLAPAAHLVPAPQSQPVPLPYDAAVATRLGRPADGCFDCQLDIPSSPQGDALPAELLPAELDFGGVHFTLAPAARAPANAVIARGQQIALPAGNYDRLYIVAAAIHADQDATFHLGSTPAELRIQQWTGYVGQWDSRLFRTKLVPLKPAADAAPDTPIRMRSELEFTGDIEPGFIKRADIAWFSSDRHGPEAAHQPYANSYLFVYGVDLPPGTKTLTLPDNDKIRVLAVSVARQSSVVEPAFPLYDTLGSDQPRPKTVPAREEE